MKLALVSGPTQEPITLSEARAHLRVDTSDDDGLIAGYILAARQYAENVCGACFAPQTWDAFFDRFCDALELPRYPVASITSVTYVDPSGATQTVASDIYSLDNGRPCSLVLLPGRNWPTARDSVNAVTVRFVSGYATNMPEDIKQALLLLIGYWYDFREMASAASVSEIPMATQSLLAPHRVYYSP